MSEQRRISVLTSLGKKYSGFIDIPNAALRTTDLLNSPNIFWKNPNEKCFENAILLYDVNLTFDEGAVFKRYEKIQIKLSEVIYFHDELESITDEQEKKRASTMIERTQEKMQSVNIITTLVANSFYDITGNFYGLFKKKAADKFLPLTNVKIVEISKKENKWFKKEINLPHRFVGVGNGHIESAIIG